MRQRSPYIGLERLCAPESLALRRSWSGGVWTTRSPRRRGCATTIFSTPAIRSPTRSRPGRHAPTPCRPRIAPPAGSLRWRWRRPTATPLRGSGIEDTIIAPQSAHLFTPSSLQMCTMVSMNVRTMTAERSCQQPGGGAPVRVAPRLPPGAAGDAPQPGWSGPVPGFPLHGHLPAIPAVALTPAFALLLPRVLPGIG